LRYKIIISAVFICAVILAIIASYSTVINDAFKDKENIVIHNEDFTPDFSVHKISKEEQGVKRYEAKLDREALNVIDEDLVTIFINKLTDHGIRVYINNQLVYKSGDMEEGNGNFKSGYHAIQLNKQVFNQDVNTIVIETYAHYKSGIETEGILITSASSGLHFEQQLTFFGQYLLFFGIGLLFMAALFILIVYFMFNREDITLLYCGLATLFIIVYFQDYINMRLGMTYLIYKKTSMISLYVCGYLYLRSISRYFDVIWIRKAMFMVTSGFILMSLLVRNMITYKVYYDYWYIAFLLLVLIAFLYSLVNIGKNPYAYLIVISFFSIGSFASVAIVFDMMGLGFSVNSPLIYIVVMAALPLLIGIDTIFQYRIELSKEQILRQTEYINANTDSLTGVGNQRSFFTNLDQLDGDGLIAIIDFDDFKYVNDTYGHLAGDEVLRVISGLIATTVSSTGDVYRYGGDEFVVLTHSTDYESFKKVMNILCQQVDHTMIDYEGRSIHITISIGVHIIRDGDDLATDLKYADKALYNSKKEGKNRVW